MKEPNDRQKALVKYMAENVGVSMQQAMIALGYSESYAASSDKIKKTKGWKKLLRKYLPDRKLVKVVNEGLEANRVISAVTGKMATGGTTDFIEVADHAVRHKFVETALKMKGKLVDRTDLTSDGKPLIQFDDQQINKIAERIATRSRSNGDPSGKEKSN